MPFQKVVPARDIPLFLEREAYAIDLEPAYARRAAGPGAGLLVSPDAHWTGDFAHVPLDVTAARRAWLTEKHVINCRPWKQALAALAA